MYIQISLYLVQSDTKLKGYLYLMNLSLPVFLTLVLATLIPIEITTLYIFIINSYIYFDFFVANLASPYSIILVFVNSCLSLYRILDAPLGMIFLFLLLIWYDNVSIVICSRFKVNYQYPGNISFKFDRKS